MKRTAEPPLILRVLFLDDCLPRNLRELDYLVIHISPQFAAPYEAHTTNPAGEPFIHWSIATAQ
jgi:hypothetical protein